MQLLHLNIDDTIIYGVDLLFQFKDFIKKFAYRDFDLLEESIQGNYDLNHIHNICSELHRVNNTLQKHIDNNNKPNISQTKHVLNYLNRWGTPQVIDIFKTVFSSEYDEEDKHNIHKMCQAYDYLLNMFKHKINLLTVKYIELRPAEIQNLNLKNQKGYMASENEIKEFLGDLK